MEEVSEFKDVEMTLCKCGYIDEEIREGAVKGKQVIGALKRIMNGRSVSVEEKRGNKE